MSFLFHNAPFQKSILYHHVRSHYVTFKDSVSASFCEWSIMLLSLKNILNMKANISLCLLHCLTVLA